MEQLQEESQEKYGGDHDYELEENSYENKYKQLE